MEPTTQRTTPKGIRQPGSRDGFGAGDHDQPFRFGHRPTSAWTHPFSSIQYARLLVLRGRIQDGERADDLTPA